MPTLPAVHRYVSNSGIRIYRIPCQVLPELTGRVYLLVGAGPVTLVDTGSGQSESWRTFLQGLESVRTRFGERVELADIRRILITHTHHDHFGGLPQLVAATGAEVAVHPYGRRVIEANAERTALARAAFRRYAQSAGVEPSRQAEMIDLFAMATGPVGSGPVAFTLDDGREFDGLRILHTPGHCPAHVCIAAGDLILVGDLILARTLTQQWPESVAPFHGLVHYLDALETVRRAGEFTMALGGHELPVREVSKRIDEIRAGQFHRLDRVRGILQGADRPLSVAEIAARMYANLDGFRAMLAICDVGARVEYLDQRGEMALANFDEIQRSDGVVHRYRLA